MTSSTEAAMSATPPARDGLKGSPNTRMPTATAVSGSMTPSTETRVEPMRWMARIRVRLDSTAVTTASRRAIASSRQECRV